MGQPDSDVVLSGLAGARAGKTCLDELRGNWSACGGQSLHARPNTSCEHVFRAIQGESLLNRVKRLVAATNLLAMPKHAVLSASMQKYVSGYECKLRALGY